MPKYKRIIVLISIIGVMAISMISVITSCSQTDASHIDQTNNKAKKVKSEIEEEKEKQKESGKKKKISQREWLEIERKRYGLIAEEDIVNMLCHISNAQEEFKKQKVKDQNKNGIGEYASNTELINFVNALKEKKSELSKMVLPERLFYRIGRRSDLTNCDTHTFFYRCRVFIPEEPEMQEQYWLGRAIRDPEDIKQDIEDGVDTEKDASVFYRSYFYYNKIDMIFYTDWDLSKVFKYYYEVYPQIEIYKDPWTLKTIFFGEPFKSPINTALWKVLNDSNNPHLRMFRWYGHDGDGNQYR